MANLLWNKFGNNPRELLFDKNHTYFDKKTGVVGFTPIGICAIRTLLKNNIFPITQAYPSNRMLTPKNDLVSRGRIFATLPIRHEMKSKYVKSEFFTLTMRAPVTGRMSKYNGRLFLSFPQLDTLNWIAKIDCTNLREEESLLMGIEEYIDFCNHHPKGNLASAVSDCIEIFDP